MKHFTFWKSTLLLLFALVVGSNAWATDFEITTSNFTRPSGSGSGYAAYDGNHTISGTTIVSSNVMIQSSKLQFKSTPGYLYNSSEMPGVITKITLDTGSNLKIYVSTSSNTETTEVTSGSSISGSYKYFKIKSNGSTGTANKITVEYSSKTATTVSLDPTSWTFNLADGETKTLSATVKAGNTTLNNASVTWSVSQGSDYASVTTAGVVSALAAGTAKIKASYAGDATYAASSAECTVTVNKANTTVTINPNGGTIDLKPANKAPIVLAPTVKATKSDNSQVNVSTPTIVWSVQSGSDYVDVTSAGVVTGKAVGTATIRATYAGGNNYNASYAECTVTVSDTRTAVNMSTFSATTNPIVAGNTTGTTVTNDQDGWTPAYTYSSTDEDVATIAADGTITAKAKGTTTIRATLNIAANDASYIPGTTTYKEFELEVTNPFYTATFSVNGDETRTASVEQGEAITFPTAVETTPETGEFPKVINQRVFQGWVTSVIATPTNDAPEFIDTDNTNMGSANITYYAVYAKVKQVESDDPNDATLAQTLQYDTWTKGGTSSSQGSYRLFGNGGYVESEAFDLSKLMKVKVFGGTYGGQDSYKYGTISDGTNKWLDFELTGNNNAKEHSFTGGSALTGTKALRIASTCGNGSASGLRMSKIEIYVKGTSSTYTKYSTTVSMLPIPEITMADVQMAWGATDKYVVPSATISGEPYAGTYTYESSNANLTVAADGKLTCNVPGSYKVTAKIAESAGNYQEEEKECNVIVTKQDITIAFPNDNADVDKILSNTAAENKFSQTATVLPAGYDGTVAYAITDGTGGASIEGTEVTYTKSGTVTVTATAPATELYNGNSVSYALKVYHANIAQVKELTSSATEVTFAANLTDAVVTYVKDNYAYLQDASAAVMVNFANHGLTAGQKINGKVTGKVKASNAIDVLTALNVTDATVTDDGVIPAATVATLATIKNAGTTYDGKLVTVNGATVTGSIATTGNSGASIKDGSQIESTDVQFNLYAPNQGIAINATEQGNFTGFVSLYVSGNNTTYRLNLYEQNQISITRNVATDQPLEFAEDAFDLDEDTEAFSNFAPQTVSGAKGAVTYAIANTTGDVIYENFNTADGTFTLKDGAYGTATITATAAATEVTEGGVTTPYKQTSKSYTVTTYPRWTVTFSVNGVETVVREAAHDAGVAVPTPAATIGEYEFVGWNTAAIATPTDDKPNTVGALSATIYPESDITYYAVYGKEGTKDVTATFTASNITNTPLTTSNTWKHTATGITLYINSGQRYTNGTPNTFTVNKGGNYFEIDTDGGKLNEITVTLSESQYEIASVESGASVSDAATANNVVTQTISFTNEMSKVKAYSPSGSNTSDQIRATIIEVDATINTLLDYRTSLPVVDVTITAAKYATFSSVYPLDFTDTGVKAYKATTNTDSSVHLVEVTVVPANTGVMLYADVDENTVFTIPVTAAEASNMDGNKLQSTAYGAHNVTADEYEKAYVFGMLNDEVGFYKAAVGKTVAQGRCYLLLDEAISLSQDAPFLSIIFDEGATTKINLNDNDNLNFDENAPRYNMSGQRVSNSYKGIVIVNGKKVVRK